MDDRPYDLLVIGGGINGAGIARDAAGRGLSVLLVERDDLAAHTSSQSTKLIHGGLRYLEYYEFRLVAESLAEREVLLRAAPHLVEPLAFVLPHEPHLRPAWMIRAGLFLYDHLGGKMTLPKSFGVRLAGSRWGAGLRPSLRRGFVYADARVDDAPDDYADPHIVDDEIKYLLDLVNGYLTRPLNRSDIVWTYSGVRPLYDDGSTDPSAITRDYVLKIDAVYGTPGRTPVLSVFG